MNAKVLAILAALAVVATLQCISAAPQVQTQTQSQSEAGQDENVQVVNFYGKTHVYKGAVQFSVSTKTDSQKTVQTVDVVYANGTRVHDEHVKYYESSEFASTSTQSSAPLQVEPKVKPEDVPDVISDILWG